MTNPATQFKPGNTVSADGRRWHQAIKQAALKRHGRSKQTMLEAAADTLVQMAVDGDIGALKEVGNRLDGQAVAVSAGVSGLTIVIQQGLADVSHDALTIEHNDTQPIDSIENISSK